MKWPLTHSLREILMTICSSNTYIHIGSLNFVYRSIWINIYIEYVYIHNIYKYIIIEIFLFIYLSDRSMKPCICAIKRTPVGKFLGGLSGLHPPDMAALAISSTMANLPPDLKIDEVMLGNVASANLGQAPARQAALKAGLPQTIPCTTINKVCSSGMKSVCFAAQAVKLGYRQAILCGGFESMSRIPHYTYVCTYILIEYIYIYIS